MKDSGVLLGQAGAQCCRKVYRSTIDFSRIPLGQLWPHQFQRELMGSFFPSRVELVSLTVSYLAGMDSWCLCWALNQARSFSVQSPFPPCSVLRAQRCHAPYGWCFFPCFCSSPLSSDCQIHNCACRAPLVTSGTVSNIHGERELPPKFTAPAERNSPWWK